MGTVRVVSGTAGGRRLVVPSGQGVRPTLHRTREALFSILGERVSGGCFLDLFSGSGALGIEALSRGARHVVFVDENPQCIRCIHENLQRCGFDAGHQVVRARLPHGLRTLRETVPLPVDVVLMDPPHGWSGREDLLHTLHHCSLLKENARIVCEHFHKDLFSSAPSHFSMDQRRKYGDTALTLFTYLPGESSHES